jgi:catechol 1,2-dioxygenase
VKPAGYPVPIDGVVGQLIKAQGRRNYRPAHLHALIYKPGFKTISAQVYVPDDPDLERDCQFGVTRNLIGDFVRHDEPPPKPGLAAPWYSLDYTFVIEPGEARWPQAPIR